MTTSTKKREQGHLAAARVALGVAASLALGTLCGTIAFNLQPVPAEFGSSTPVGTALSPTPRMVRSYADAGADVWYKNYVTSRIVEVPILEGEPWTFGPWTAIKDYGAPDAHADGSLTEWAENYFIAHDWSDYGRDILTMMPGDVVTVNGALVTVARIFNYPKDSYYDEIMTIAGEDTVVFQTCFPDSDQNRIVCATTQ